MLPGEHFCAFLQSYRSRYQQRTRSVFRQARIYVSGFIQAHRCNMERLTEAVSESGYQSLRHFLSHSDWDWRGVMEQVAHDTDELFGERVGLIKTRLYLPKG